MTSKRLIIRFRDGQTEKYYVDDYGVEDGCLFYYIRFGVDSGKHFFPLDTIAEWIVN